MSDASHNIPYDIEAPVPILFFDPLEFTLAIVSLGFGVIFHVFPLGILAAVGVLMGSRYLKRGAKRGATQHFLWSRGLQLDAALTSRFKPAWVNDFTE